MSLPNIDIPVYETTLPTSGELVKFRPFTVKEKKIIMMANESNNSEAMVKSMFQIIENCTFQKINPEKISMIDIQYLFIKIRSKSMGEKTDFSFSCPKCNTPITSTINLDNIEIKKNPEHTNNIKLTDSVGIVFKYPDFTLEKILADKSSTSIEKELKAIALCVDYIYDASSTYHSKDIDQKELISYIENLTDDHFDKIKHFFDTMPKFADEVNYKCEKCGHSDKLIIDDVINFFE